MSGALHDGEAPNAHERPQPVELLQQGLGEAGQALDHVEEGHAVSGVAAGRDDLQEYVVGERDQRKSCGGRLRARASWRASFATKRNACTNPYSAGAHGPHSSLVFF